jgi:hypothetical protein
MGGRGRVVSLEGDRMSKELDTKPDVEPFKMLADWSKWLLTLEAGICTLLWSKVNAPPDKAAEAASKAAEIGKCLPSTASKPLILGWMFFVGSIAFASILLIFIPYFLSRKRDVAVDRRNLSKIWVLAGGEYACFLTGCVFLAYHVYKNFP